MERHFPSHLRITPTFLFQISGLFYSFGLYCSREYNLKIVLIIRLSCYLRKKQDKVLSCISNYIINSGFIWLYFCRSIIQLGCSFHVERAYDSFSDLESWLVLEEDMGYMILPGYGVMFLKMFSLDWLVANGRMDILS